MFAAVGFGVMMLWLTLSIFPQLHVLPFNIGICTGIILPLLTNVHVANFISNNAANTSTNTTSATTTPTTTS